MIKNVIKSEIDKMFIYILCEPCKDNNYANIIVWKDKLKVPYVNF